MKHMKMNKGGRTPFGMLSVEAGIDKNPKATQADRIAGATNKADYGMKIKDMMMMDGGKMKYGHGGKNEYGHGGKNEYGDGGKAQRPGGDVDALLEMLANFDQNSSVGEFLDLLMSQSMNKGVPTVEPARSNVAEAAAQGAGAGAGALMRNLPPKDVESLLRQLGQQGQ